jgi:hypothetical protein
MVCKVGNIESIGEVDSEIADNCSGIRNKVCGKKSGITDKG